MLDNQKMADEVMRKLEIVKKNMADIVNALNDTEFFLRTNSYSERFDSLLDDLDCTMNAIKTLANHIKQLILLYRQRSISKKMED